MSNSKVAISLRLDPYLHTIVRKISEVDEKSMNDVVSNAIRAYADTRVIREHIDTQHPDFHIAIDKDLFGYSTLTLYSSYAGTDHVVFKAVSDENLDAAINHLCSLIDFYDACLD